MKNLAFLLLISTTLFSCSTMKVTQNMDTSVDFSQFKTYSYYGWDSTSTHINDYYKKEIEYSFAEEFKKRGLAYDPSGNGDLVVSLYLLIDVDKGVRAYNTYYAGGPNGFYQPVWGWGYGYGAPYSYGGVVYEEYNYMTGTLICDVFVNQSKTIAWQGIVSKSIDTNKKGKNIPKVIDRLMLNFPIKKLTEN